MNNWHKKDATYDNQVAANDWPQDKCIACRLNLERMPAFDAPSMMSCCQRLSHHHGDCCLHCGNDERYEGKWGYRGMFPPYETRKGR